MEGDRISPYSPQQERMYGGNVEKNNQTVNAKGRRWNKIATGLMAFGAIAVIGGVGATIAAGPEIGLPIITVGAVSLLIGIIMKLIARRILNARPSVSHQQQNYRRNSEPIIQELPQIRRQSEPEDPLSRQRRVVEIPQQNQGVDKPNVPQDKGSDSIPTNSPYQSEEEDGPTNEDRDSSSPESNIPTAPPLPESPGVFKKPQTPKTDKNEKPTNPEKPKEEEVPARTEDPMKMVAKGQLELPKLKKTDGPVKQTPIPAYVDYRAVLDKKTDKK